MPFRNLSIVFLLLIHLLLLGLIVTVLIMQLLLNEPRLLLVTIKLILQLLDSFNVLIYLNHELLVIVLHRLIHFQKCGLILL